METKSAPPSASQGGGSPRRWRWYAAMTAGYLVFASALVWLSRASINPDGIAYVEAARHYAAGRLDLAVNGWFGPMLSWLLAPACWLGVEPFFVARVLGAIYGVLFACATVRLAGAIGGGRYALWAYAAALMLSLRTVIAEVTPDFLMTAGLTWYFALAAEMIRTSSLRKAALAGLVGGACYYAKAYALPMVVAHMLITLIVRWAAARKSAASAGSQPAAPLPTKMGLARIAAPPTLAAGVALLVCAPWIAIISHQFGRFTTNTSASLSAQTWLSGKSGVPRAFRSASYYPHFLLQQPPEGRMTVWENPAESRGDWPAWPKGDLSDYAKWQWKTITYNLGDMLTFFNKAEFLCLLPIGAIAALVLGIALRGAGELRAYWIWGSLTAALYMGGYLVLYLYERFIWGSWGILIALAASLLAYFAGGRGAAHRSAAGKRKQYPPPSATGKKLCRLVAVVVLISIAGRFADRLYYEAANPMSESLMGAWVRQAADSFPHKGQGVRIASNDWWKGLYFSCWSGSVFLGQYPSGETRPNDPAGELRPYSPLDVLIFESPERPWLAEVLLKQVPGFRPVGQSRDPRSGWMLTELGFEAKSQARQQ